MKDTYTMQPLKWTTELVEKESLTRFIFSAECFTDRYVLKVRRNHFARNRHDISIDCTYNGRYCITHYFATVADARRFAESEYKERLSRYLNRLDKVLC